VVRAEQGDLEGALELLQRALTIKQSKLGSSHVDLAVVHRNIASVLHRLGRDDEALPHARQALSQLGADDETADAAALEESHAVMATITAQLGAPEEAVDHARRARDLAQGRLGESHPGFARRSRELAVALRGAGRGEEAVRAAQTAVTIFRASAGEQPRELGLSLTELASDELAAGRPPADAVAHAQEAVGLLGSSPADRAAQDGARQVLAEAQRGDGVTGNTGAGGG
jgi:tetratricopeptide (TPR) repeat protein